MQKILLLLLLPTLAIAQPIDPVPRRATSVEAAAGVNNTKFITPFTLKGVTDLLEAGANPNGLTNNDTRNVKINGVLTATNIVANAITNSSGNPALTSTAGEGVRVYEPNQGTPVLVADDQSLTIRVGDNAIVNAQEDVVTFQSQDQTAGVRVEVEGQAVRVFPFITVPEGDAPGNAGVGYVNIYAKTDGKLYAKDDAGNEYDLTAAGTGGGAFIDEVDGVGTNTVFKTSDDVIVYSVASGRLYDASDAGGGVGNLSIDYHNRELVGVGNDIAYNWETRTFTGVHTFSDGISSPSFTVDAVLSATIYFATNNSDGSDLADFSGPSIVTTNLANNLTFGGVTGFSGTGGTNYYSKIYYIVATGANRTITPDDEWVTTRANHVATNGVLTKIQIDMQVGVFTNMSQLDFPH